MGKIFAHNYSNDMHNYCKAEIKYVKNESDNDGL